MPGKRNPTIAEVVVQAAFAVMGNHATISMAGAAGTFELNVAKPIIIDRILQSIRILADSARVFALRLVQDLDINRERLAANVANALLLPTVLNPVLGYDRVAQITTRALTDGTPPREAALALGFLTGEEYDRLVDARAMTTPSSSDGARPVAGEDRDDRRR